MKYVISSMLLAALAMGQNWIVEQIDSTAKAGSSVELVKAADGRIWAGYQTDSGVLRVACFTDSGWSHTDVCSSAVLPWIGYRPSLAASTNGELCLAYRDAAAGDNRLCRMVGDSWHSEPNPYADSYPCNTVAYDTSGRLYTLLQPWTARFVLAHETDSGWMAGEVVQLPVYGFGYLGNVAYLTAAADGSPWFFGFSGWIDGPKGDCRTELMHFVGDTWVDVWQVAGWIDLPPIPAVLVPHGQGVGNLASYNGSFLCDSEPIASVSDLPVAGLTYSQSDVPLVAWVPLYSPARPVFAFKTNRWHTESIPGPVGIGGLDIETDTAGQVVIVYSTEDSGLWCARGADVVGAKESPEPQALGRKVAPTILSGVSSVNRLAPGVAFDAMGRRVASPTSGVYFLLQASSVGRGASSVTKVVIQR
jgi:hypothetical protein